MIDWRSAVTWFPGIGSSVRDARRGLYFTWRLRRARIIARTSRSATRAVPWTVLDVVVAATWTFALLAGAAIGLVLLRMALAFGFALAESSGHVHSGTFDRLMDTLHPYMPLASLLLLALAGCGAVFYGIYRTTIRRYHLPWAALSLRHAGWKTYALAGALIVPLSLAGALITRGESMLLHTPIHDARDTLLTRGIAALPLNFLQLFVILVLVMPVAEEVFFRGFLYRLLRRDFPLWAAASGSAVPYGLLHGVPLLLPWFFFMGIAYALVVERTQSLYCSIILHSLVNALATLGIIAVICNW